MAKKKTQKKVKNEIQSLTSKVQSLSARLAQGGGKKKKKKGKGNKGAKGATKVRKALPDVANLGSFARGFLDPFGLRGSRVPDSSLVRTTTSYSHYWIGASNAVPSFNFTNATAYLHIAAAPLFDPAANPLRCASTPDAMQSVWNYTGNTAPTTIDYTKIWGGLTQANNRGTVTNGYKNFRVSGGGVKIKLVGISSTQQVDVYAVPMFNGDTSTPYWQNVIAQRVRHWKLTAGNHEVVIPWPVRSTNDAFEYCKGTLTGAATTDYPTDDKVTSTFSGFVYTASTDVGNTNAAVDAWSMQSGLGGWQIMFSLPPGSGWNCESIVHAECIMNQTVPSYYVGDSDSAVSLADHAQLEKVGNLVAMTCNKDETVTGSTASPWTELAGELGSQTLAGMTDALKDSKLLRRAVGGAASYFGGGFNPYQIMY